MLPALAAMDATARRSVRDYSRRTFSSLKIRNFRLYFLGQGFSLVGTFMQGFAQSWLVLTLTGHATEVGLVSALQFGPVLFLAPYGGILADRFSKRRLLVFTQTVSGLLALVLGILVVTHAIRLWMVFAIALCLGVVNSLDNPTRHSFAHELVGKDEVSNAVSLNTTALNLSRIVGPAVAGLFISTVGFAPCFFFNAASFGAVILSLFLIRSAELHRMAPVAPAKGQVRAGFAYVWRTPVLRDALIMMAMIGTMTYEFQVSLPLLAQKVFRAGAGGAALLVAMMGVGAVAGGLIFAGRSRSDMRSLAIASAAFGASVILAASVPTLPFAAAAMLLVGVSSLAFATSSNAILQVNSASQMRGRVMSLWSMAFLGSTVIGAPIVGLLGDHASPQWALAIGGIAALAAGAFGLSAMHRHAAAPSRAAEALLEGG